MWRSTFRGSLVSIQGSLFLESGGGGAEEGTALERSCAVSPVTLGALLGLVTPLSDLSSSSEKEGGILFPIAKQRARTRIMPIVWLGTVGPKGRGQRVTCLLQGPTQKEVCDSCSVALGVHSNSFLDTVACLHSD